MGGTRLLVVGKYDDWDMEPMRAAHDIVLVETSEDIAGLPEEQRRGIAAMAFRGHDLLSRAQMALLPDLGIVANYGVGFDAIDVDAATALGIRVTNTPDVLTDDVAELAVAMAVAQARGMLAGSEWVRSGRWARDGAMPLMRRVNGARAGVVGLGRIGRAIADRLDAFRMEIHYSSRSEKETPATWRYHADAVAMAREVDFLFVALVGGAETEGYVSAEMIDALGPDGMIVNISRGSTIDEGAMLDALEQGRLGSAALDVFVNEPDVDPRFLALDNVLLLPHIGSASVETRKAMGQLQRDNIAAFLAGKALLTPVN